MYDDERMFWIPKISSEFKLEVQFLSVVVILEDFILTTIYSVKCELLAYQSCISVQVKIYENK